MTNGFEEFERRGLESTLGAVVRARVALLVMITLLGLWIGYVDPALWRRVLLGVLVVSLTVLDVGTRYRFQRHGFEPASIRVNLALMKAFQAGLILATGGLGSPLLPVMLPPALASGILLGRRGVVLVLALQVPAILGFWLLHWSNAIPDLIPSPFRPEGGPSLVALSVGAFVMSTLVPVFAFLGSRLRRVTQAHLGQVADAQETALASHRQRADELTTLGAEIAHELKNPLASVKGLTQLLARAKEGDPAKMRERLGVLEREVDRMQAILEEFLNFSRPLTPLDRSDVAVAGICRDVVTLHEAMAAERGVHLGLSCPEDLRLRGDGRKIGQVLINLLQNALEVAPAGSTVALNAREENDGVTLEVTDAGPGLPEDVGPRVFEPGVTTKASGNGLGLTIARAIAGQHGGTLVLEDSEGGGCRAIVRLPNDPAPAVVADGEAP